MKVFTFAPIIPTLDEVLSKGNKAGHNIIMDGTKLDLKSDGSLRGNVYGEKRGYFSGSVVNGSGAVWIDINDENYVKITTGQLQLGMDLNVNNNDVQNVLKCVFGNGGMNTSPSEKEIWYNDKIGCYAATDKNGLRNGLGAYADIFLYDVVRHKYDFISEAELDNFTLNVNTGTVNVSRIDHANGYMRMNMSNGTDEANIKSNNANIYIDAQSKGIFTCTARFGKVGDTEYQIGICDQNGNFIAGIRVTGGTVYWRHGSWDGSAWTYSDESTGYSVSEGGIFNFYILIDGQNVTFVLSNGTQSEVYNTNYEGNAYFYLYGHNSSGASRHVDIDFYASLCKRRYV